RRRHTRFSRDWSSDVCSSDLKTRPARNLHRSRSTTAAWRRARVDDEAGKRAAGVNPTGWSRESSNGAALAPFPPVPTECHERTAPAVLCHEQYPGASPLIYTQTTTQRSSSWL